MSGHHVGFIVSSGLGWRRMLCRLLTFHSPSSACLFKSCSFLFSLNIMHFDQPKGKNYCWQFNASAIHGCVVTLHFFMLQCNIFFGTLFQFLYCESTVLMAWCWRGRSKKGKTGPTYMKGGGGTSTQKIVIYLEWRESTSPHWKGNLESTLSCIYLLWGQPREFFEHGSIGGSSHLRIKDKENCKSSCFGFCCHGEKSSPWFVKNTQFCC